MPDGAARRRAPARRRSRSRTPPATALGRHPAAPQPRPRHRRPSAPSAPPSSARSPDWEAAARAPGAAIKAATHGPPRRATSSSSRSRSPPAAAPCTGPATPTRPTAIVTDLVRATGADEVVKVKSMATQEIGLNEALEAAGIAALRDRPRRADRPARRRQARRTSWCPAIHRNRAEIREIFLREMPGVDPALTDEPRRLAEAARAHLRERFLRGQGRDLRRQLRASPRPARSPSSSPRATGGCA